MSAGKFPLLPSYTMVAPTDCGPLVCGLHSRNACIRTSQAQSRTPSQAEENKRWGAKLKLFLGYAPGVGKSYRMLDEARRRHERGEDVVVGAVQGQQSEEVQAILKKLETIPTLQTPEGQAIDLDAILRRAPQVCVIDPLAAMNRPGSRHDYRWQDVQELLRNGISVLSSVNLLHVEEYKDNVQAITGKNTTETIPKSFLLAADDIVIVDVPPEWTSRAVIKSHKFLWRTHTSVFSSGYLARISPRTLSAWRKTFKSP